jgi:hypothetical protein
MLSGSARGNLISPQRAAWIILQMVNRPGTSIETIIPEPRLFAYMDALLPLAGLALEPSLSMLISARDAGWKLESNGRWYVPHRRKTLDELRIDIMHYLYEAAESTNDALAIALADAVVEDEQAIEEARLDRATTASLPGCDRFRQLVLRVLRSPTARKLRAFLSYCREDLNAARPLYERLTSAGIDVWFDQVALLPGQDWKVEIEKAVRLSDVVIVCLSSRAVNKVGYVQKEIREALQFAQEHPPGAVFVIPIQLEACAIPATLQHLHAVDVSTDMGYQKLLLVVQQRSRQLEEGA